LDGIVRVPNGTEFYIHPDVRKSDGSALLKQEIDDHQSLGNGVVVGDIGLETANPNEQSKLVPAVWIVVAEPDIAKADANIAKMADIINQS
jgi:hypothetical protein